MVDTEIRLIIFFAAKEGEALYNEIALMEQRQQNNLSQLTSLMAMGYEPTDDELPNLLHLYSE